MIHHHHNMTFISSLNSGRRVDNNDQRKRKKGKYSKQSELSFHTHKGLPSFIYLQKKAQNEKLGMNEFTKKDGRREKGSEIKQDTSSSPTPVTPFFLYLPIQAPKTLYTHITALNSLTAHIFYLYHIAPLSLTPLRLPTNPSFPTPRDGKLGIDHPGIKSY